MPERNIVTQVGIEDLKFALAEIAENLSAHANASLSRAHGINAMSGYVDSSGNDLTSYQDSNGDVIGNYFLRFSVNNVVYFAPGNFTLLPGQTATSGIVDTSLTAQAAQGDSAWVTSYTSDQVTQARAINNDVLIPHTRKPHWDAHGGTTVIVRDTFSSAGHRVGTHVLRMRFGDNLYEIPCSTRFGGPAQPPRIGGIATNLSVEIGSGDPNQVNLPVTVPFIGGTKPVAYRWQFSNSGVWTDITPASSGSLVIPGWSSGIDFQWSATSNPTFRITAVFPGSDETRSAQFRCRVTNEVTPDTGPESGVLTNVLTLTATDNTGGCFITTATCLGAGRGDTCYELETLRAFRDNWMQKTQRSRKLLDDYRTVGPLIVKAMRADSDVHALCAKLHATYILPSANLIQNGKYRAAEDLYVQMVNGLKTQFRIK